MQPQADIQQPQLLTSGFSEGLECIAQGRNVIVPAESVARIIECDLVPLPLSRSHVSGVGVHEDQIVVLLRLFEKAPERDKRRSMGALLHSPHGGARFALEVVRVVSLVSARPIGSAGPWVLRVTTTDGRTLPWLLVDRVLQELGVREGA